LLFSRRKREYLKKDLPEHKPGGIPIIALNDLRTQNIIINNI